MLCLACRLGTPMIPPVPLLSWATATATGAIAATVTVMAMLLLVPVLLSRFLLPPPHSTMATPLLRPSKGMGMDMDMDKARRRKASSRSLTLLPSGGTQLIRTPRVLEDLDLHLRLLPALSLQTRRGTRPSPWHNCNRNLGNSRIQEAQTSCGWLVVLFSWDWWGLDGCITTDNLTITLTSSRYSSFFPPPRRPINILPPPYFFSFHQSIIPSHHPSSSIHHHSSYFLFSKNPLKEKKWYPHVRTSAVRKKNVPTTLIDTSVPFFFLQSLLSLLFALGRLLSVLLSFSNVLSICFRIIRTEETFIFSFVLCPANVYHLRSISIHNGNIFRFM